MCPHSTIDTVWIKKESRSNRNIELKQDNIRIFITKGIYLNCKTDFYDMGEYACGIYLK